MFYINNGAVIFVDLIHVRKSAFGGELPPPTAGGRAAADRSSDARQVVVGGGQRVDLTSAPHRWVSSTSILGRKRVWERLD